MFVSFTNNPFTLLLPLYFSLTYPGADTLLSISSTPTLHEVDKLTLDHVACQWEKVAPHLVVESFGVCKIIESGQLQEESRGALSRWLKGESDTDIAEKTRCSVLEAKEASRNISIASNGRFLKRALKNQLLVLPLLQVRVCVCVCRIYVWILFAMSIHCTAQSTCQWLFLHFHVCIYCALSRSLHITTFKRKLLAQICAIVVRIFMDSSAANHGDDYIGGRRRRVYTYKRHEAICDCM